ncbi:T9SS type A sorting domain-containing protein [Winogradskyella haliclonae]|uniref:Secretion system C-terminal sorting domain-containing protein n=1 Tax=Winogradskyella haliclonae TaxID=2048558 RepID=A0ABQ2BZX4_9FLAO|nr:T9SS type A sorting domain-containing protein [Winogradskyella haliclonae]GGI57496.1 hypothetical protein GCM10011444_18050 [Winogradskyella haliclonae]
MKSTLLYLSLFFISGVSAQVIFQEDFSALNTNQSLNGQGSWSNDTSMGGTGAVFGGTPSNVVAFSLSYPDYGSSANSVQSINNINSDGPGHLFSSSITAGTFYTSFVMNISDSPSSSPFDVIRVLNGSAFSTALRIWVQDSGSGFSIGIKSGDSSNNGAVTSQVYSFNTAYLVVLKYTINSGASNDELELFINPNYVNGEPVSSTLIAPAPAIENSSSIDRLAFAWNVPNSGRFSGHVGLVSVASTWSDLVLSNTNIRYNNLDVKYINNSKSVQFSASVSGQLNIYNITGQSIKALQLNNDSMVNLSDLKKGIYLSKFTSNIGETKIVKFVIN